MDTSQAISFNGLSWILIPTAVYLLYRYFMIGYNYFEKQAVIYDRNIVPIFGNLWGSWRKVPSEEDARKHKLFGNLWGEFEGYTPIWVTVDMDMIKSVFVRNSEYFMSLRNFQVSSEILNQILFSLEGERWRTVRKLMTPGFSSKRIKTMCEDMQQCAETLLKNIEDKGENNTLDLRNTFSGFAMDVIASCGFGTRIDSLKDPSNEFVKYSESFTKSFIENPLAVLPFIIKRSWLKYLPSILGEEGGEFFVKVTRSVVKMRKESGQRRDDFLDALIDSSIEGGKENGLDDTTFVAQCVTFFLAGNETITMTLTYTIYCLAMNPEVQERLYQHIVASESGKPLSYEELKNSKFLEYCVLETLRLHPILPRIERKATKTFTYNGYTIHEGSIVRVPVPLIHRNEKYFPNPEEYRPERFSTQNEESFTYTFLSFGLGARACLGRRFAMEEVKLALYHLVKTYRFHPSEKTPKKISYSKNGFMQSVSELEIGFARREGI